MEVMKNMDEVRVHDKTFRLLISQDDLQKRIREIAIEINEVYSDRSPLFVGILNGVFMFAGDLMKNISIPCEIVIATVLRAGLPFHQGFLNYFDKAENAFVSAYREYSNQTEFDVYVEYIATPNLDGKTLILCDPMLATGTSIRLAYKALLEYGVPSIVHVAGVVASEQGIQYIQDHFPDNTEIWVAAIDKELSPKAYIVPGLGDAGDLAYGPKERVKK